MQQELARKVDGQWVPLAPFEHGGVQYPVAWFDPASWDTPAALAAEMARLGVAAVVQPGPAPADQHVLGQSIADVGGVPHRVWTVASYSLDEARAVMWERVKALREAKANGSAATPFGHRADSDDASRLRITGGVLLADKAIAAGQAFAINWTMSDNTLVPLDAEGMNILGVVVGQHYAACYTRAQELRAEIAASTAPFDINIETGWPA